LGEKEREREREREMVAIRKQVVKDSQILIRSPHNWSTSGWRPPDTDSVNQNQRRQWFNSQFNTKKTKHLGRKPLMQIL
jgi:hypothetical protein